MSAYVELQTQFTDRDALVAALLAVGIAGHALSADQIELAPEGASLYGYRGDRRTTQAHVIVRRKDVCWAANDVGFELKDGKYVAHVSEFDRGEWAEKTGWLGKVSQQYAKAVVVKKAKKLGYRVAETMQADGSVRLALLR